MNYKEHLDFIIAGIEPNKISQLTYCLNNLGFPITNDLVELLCRDRLSILEALNTRDLYRLNSVVKAWWEKQPEEMKVKLTNLNQDQLTLELTNAIKGELEKAGEEGVRLFPDIEINDIRDVAGNLADWINKFAPRWKTGEITGHSIRLIKQISDTVIKVATMPREQHDEYVAISKKGGNVTRAFAVAKPGDMELRIPVGNGVVVLSPVKISLEKVIPQQKKKL